MTFDELNLIEPLMRAVTEKGYDTPTPIQAEAIPPALRGRDLLGCAQTGTGKTAAFTLPILQLLTAEPVRGKRPVRALVITPTRELAIQIDDCCREYARHTQLRHTVIFGGVGQRPQVEALQRGVDLLIATPGRLLDLIGQGYISLADVRFFVLDEADRMLDMGFIHDIRRIVPLLPKERQTLFFSATMPDDIVRLASSMLRDPVHITVTPQASVVETIRQSIRFVEKSDKKDLLTELLRERSEQSVLVFSRTKHGADRIARILTKAGIEGRAIHGDKSQGARERAMGDFRAGTCRVLIATDIAARGIDISELPLVINYDLPEVAETYVHRIGRTGRAGCEGTAISFCSEEERPLLADIQKLTGQTLSEDPQTGEKMLEKQTVASRDDRKQSAPKQHIQKQAAQPQSAKSPRPRQTERQKSERQNASQPQTDAPKSGRSRSRRRRRPENSSANSPVNRTANTSESRTKNRSESRPAEAKSPRRERKPETPQQPRSEQAPQKKKSWWPFG